MPRDPAAAGDGLRSRTFAVAIGLLTATFPFLLHGTGGHVDGDRPHGDHASARGGLLSMSGDHHLELVVRPAEIWLFTTDAFRRPVRPVSATAEFDDGVEHRMLRRGAAWVARLPGAAGEVTVRVRLADGTRVFSTFPVL